MILPITLTVAGAAAIINIWLAVRVGKLRVSGKIPTGDGGSPALLARMRAHANYTEYTPFVLILIGLIEAAAGTATWLWLVGGVYLLARVAHAIGMDRPAPNPFRLGGIALTMVILLGLGLYAVALPYLLAGQSSAIEMVSIG